MAAHFLTCSEALTEVEVLLSLNISFPAQALSLKIWEYLCLCQSYLKAQKTKRDKQEAFQLQTAVKGIKGISSSALNGLQTQPENVSVVGRAFWGHANLCQSSSTGGSCTNHGAKSQQWVIQRHAPDSKDNLQNPQSPAVNFSTEELLLRKRNLMNSWLGFC